MSRVAVDVLDTSITTVDVHLELFLVTVATDSVDADVIVRSSLVSCVGSSLSTGSTGNECSGSNESCSVVSFEVFHCWFEKFDCLSKGEPPSL